MAESEDRFATWLEASMRARGLTQAELARSMGVAETQVSRWRRGLAVPTVRSLQRLAETFAVPRTTLDSLAGYPTGEPEEGQGSEARRPELPGELQAYQMLLGQLLAQRVPRELWQVYVAGCAALAEALERSFQATLRRAEEQLREAPGGSDESPAHPEPRAPQSTQQLGFRVPGRQQAERSEEPNRAT